jgi:hypothetical protein
MKQIQNNNKIHRNIHPYQIMDLKNLKKKIRESRIFILCDFRLQAAGALDEPQPEKPAQRN